jgi:hypothetical protein
LQQAPSQEAVRQIGRQIAELIGADNGNWETAQIAGEIVQVAPGPDAHIREIQLAPVAQPHSRGDFELPVSRLPAAGEQVGARIGPRLGRNPVQDDQAGGLVLHVANPKPQVPRERLFHLHASSRAPR